MKIIAPANGDGFTLPAPGIHAARVVGVEDLGEEVNPFDRAKKRHQLKITFDLGNGTTQFLWCNATLASGSNLRSLVEALLGSAPPVFETDALIGQTCEIEIRHYTDGKGKRRSRVTEVLPLSEQPS